jgi:hypothetical protein
MAKISVNKQHYRSRGYNISILLILMLVIGCVSGFLSYGFGQKALKGVNPIPLGVKMPRLNPTAQPKQDIPKSFSDVSSTTIVIDVLGLRIPWQ